MPADPVAAGRPSRPTALVLGVAAGVVAVDQLTKWWAVEVLDDRSIELFWTLRLRLIFNTGSAFSFGAGRGGLIGLVAIGVVLVMLWLSRSVDNRRGAVGLGLVLGGAIGNLADRAFRTGGDGFLSGAVVDFVDLQWWPVFNVADAAIVIGALLLVVMGAGRRVGEASGPPVAAGGPSPP
jgi:signal peptidase II